MALKRNRPTLDDEVAAYFDDPATTGLATSVNVAKDHGRIETRTTTVSHEIEWLEGGRRHPGEHRFHRLRSLVRATTQVERLGKTPQGKTSRETRFFISSALLTPERAATAIRSHWGAESLHWVLDVVFKEDPSRLMRGHGAQNSEGSPSISSAPERENAPSKQPEKPLDGTQTPSPISSIPRRVALYSLP